MHSCYIWAFLYLCWGDVAYAAADAVVSEVLLGLTVIFITAKIFGYTATKFHQPAVLGELVAGVVIGNLTLFGVDTFSFIPENDVFSVLASVGVILLLFEIGLESSVDDLMGVGISSTLVAVTGVIAPFALGWFISEYTLPEASEYVHAFVGATLCATSVGITARVLKDIAQINSREAKIILGAAVIDDVLGLIILAVVAGVISAADAGSAEGFSVSTALWITVKAVGFVMGALIVGARLAPSLFKLGARIKLEGMLLATTLAFCFLMAYLSGLAGLAPIVGAFAAGLIVDGTGFAKYFPKSDYSIEDLLLPVSSFFVPIFFVMMGTEVDLRAFFDIEVLYLSAGLVIAAIVGKQLCGLAVVEKKINRLAVGIGMIPRGEVGLIFASIGSTLMLNDEPIVDQTLFSAIVVMVAVTTMLTPPLLKAAFRVR